MKWNRRSFLGTIGAVTGSLAAPHKLFSAKAETKISGFGHTGNPFEELGVATVINCEMREAVSMPDDNPLIENALTCTPYLAMRSGRGSDSNPGRTPSGVAGWC